MSQEKRRSRWWSLGVLVLAGLVLWLWMRGGGWGASHFLALRSQLEAAHQAHPVQTWWVFAGVYVLSTALSLPGATALTLVAAALFGPWSALLLVSMASSVGATLACLGVRYALRAPVQRWLGPRYRQIEEGFRREGDWYLLSLRLAPVVPFWSINLLMGLSTMPIGRFYVISQLGMLPGTMLYVHAGSQMGELESLGQIWTPAVVASWVALLGFPWVARAVWKAWQQHRLHAAWRRPRHFDRNLVVIGAGAGGLVTAYMAAVFKARVTLIEAEQMGGDCLNRGCVPSKALIRAAKAAQAVREAGQFGVQTAAPVIDFPAVMGRVRQTIDRIEPHDSVERYTALGVEVLRGRGRLLDPWTVEVEQEGGIRQTFTTRHVVLATGSRPVLPDIPGLQAASPLTSDTLWQLDTLPARLVILGGGAMGCEMAQAFARLGSQVWLLDRGARLLHQESPAVGDAVYATLCQAGVQVRLNSTVVSVTKEAAETVLQVRDPTHTETWACDRILCATGRRARVDGLGLEALGLDLETDGAIATDAYLQTRYAHIWAVGDVTGRSKTTHAAAHQAWHVAVNALFGRFWRFRADTLGLPRVVFTDPEVACVGWTAEQAQERGWVVERHRHELSELDRALIEGEPHGFVEVLTAAGGGRILGVSVVAPGAGEWLAEWSLAWRHGMGMDRILATVHPYPTWSELNRQVAGRWKQQRVSPRWSTLLARYQGWQRH